MISESIINAVLKASKPELKDNLIKILLGYVNNQCDYYDKKVSHLLEMLVDNKAFIEPEHINMDYIRNNKNLILYNHDKYDIKDIALEYVDNVDCVAVISFKYLEKLNEDRNDVEYHNGRINISFIDNPEVLKKS